MARDYGRAHYIKFKAQAEYGFVCETPECVNDTAYPFPLCGECYERLGVFDPRESRAEASFVYFVLNRDTGSIKIGVSTDPQKRLSAMQSGTDSELILLATVTCKHDPNLEAHLHAAYAKHRKVREWFHPSDEVLDLVEWAQDGDLGKILFAAENGRRALGRKKDLTAKGKSVTRGGKSVAYIMS